MQTLSYEAPGATVGLVLGIISVVLHIPIASLVVAIIGFQKAREAKSLIDANPGAYTNTGVAQAGYVLTIIGMCLGGLSTLCGCGYFVFLAIAIAGAASGAAGSHP